MKSIPQNVTKSVRLRNPHLYGDDALKFIGTATEVAAFLKQSRKAVKAKRIRQDSRPLLNKLEAEWQRILMMHGDHRFIHPQSVTFKLANGLRYTPDFVCQRFNAPTGVWYPVIYEVKGPHAFDGALDKLKMAASLYPEYEWILVWKDNGEWKQQVVLP